VCNVVRGLDISLSGRRVLTASDVIQLVQDNPTPSSNYDLQYMQDHEMLSDEYTYVKVRLRAGTVPFATFDIISPSYTPDNPKFDTGVFVEFWLNSKGEIVSSIASNLHVVEKEAPDPQPILSWQECLKVLTKTERVSESYCTIKVISAEFCYAINGKGITYPVWQFMLEFSFSPGLTDSVIYQFQCYPHYIDAHTGQCL